ncbi:MAG: PD40 domain-containing protein [Planctomycetes bacterium]|nr:PD40 domain-containing protein [Planctomycetota bacterium]
MSRSILSTSLLALVLLAPRATAQFRPDAVMLRQPDVSKEHIVFGFGGDLWLVAKSGGVARVLASPDGSESMPRFSPDGKRVAFTASYAGGTDVYVLPIDGGVPQRVTHHPDNEVLCDWDPTGRDIVFFSSQISGQRRAPKLFRAPVDGGQPTPLPVPYGTFGELDATSTWLAYTPVTQSEFRTWKRYQGGMAQDIWLFNVKTNESKRMTSYPGTDCLPMWHGREIYFLSDRDDVGRLNVWRFDSASGTTEAITKFTDDDVRFPSVGPDDLVFTCAGKLYRYEFASKKTIAVDVVLPNDRPQLLAQKVDCSELVQTVTAGPKGKRVAVEARGEIFSVPVKEGAVLDLTQTDGAAERQPAWSPDGKWLAYVSDRSGENEICVRPADSIGVDAERTLTKLGPGYRFGPTWSPDSKSIAFSANDGSLSVVGVEKGDVRVLDNDRDGQPMSARWSPDSRWLTYARRGAEGRLSSIFLCDTRDGSVHEVTSGKFIDREPSFDAEGKWLFYVSSRVFEPVYSEFDETWIYGNSQKLVAVPLRADVKNPWAPKDDSETAADDEEAEAEDSKDATKADAKTAAAAKPAEDAKPGDDAKAEAKAPTPVEIELAGFEARAILVDVPGGRIDSVRGAKGKVAYVRRARLGAESGEANDDDEGGGGPSGKLVYLDLEDKEEHEVLDGVAGFELLPGGEKALVAVDGFALVDLAEGQKVEKKIALEHLDATIDPRREWRQIVTEAGRLMRDFFYVPEMHYVDWNAVVARYVRALDDCTTRADVDFLLRELVAELNVGHAYVASPGSLEAGRRPPTVGLLGCDWKLERGAYRIARLVGGDASDLDARSPLAIPGIDAKAGDFLLAVNDVPVDATRDVYAAFEGTVGRPTWITLNAEPTRDGKERRVLVEPIASEGELRYRDWVAQNRALVAKLTDGRVGYVHVPDTGIHGQNELVRQFMGEFAKPALIVDERWNGGGQIPTRFIELLDRPVTNYWAVRHGEDWTWPSVGHRGPKCMLINESSGSGGDCFPYFFRQAGLGKLIGTRTWGGLVGLSGNPGFVDGSSITVPTFGFYEKDGTWGVEGHGVDPDLDVVDDPSLMVDGGDPQLLAAIREMQAELAKAKPEAPKRPASPNRVKPGIAPADH